MVYELKDGNELREYIIRNSLVVLAITNKDKESLWRYIIDIFTKLEQSVKPSIMFTVVHYQSIASELKPFEVDQAQRSIIIKMFLNGRCIFEQEGVLGSKVNDEIALKRGIRESLKPYAIRVKFT